jgi:CDP-L-myo-inositol myo-inositolphosphotransferase
MVDGLDDVLIVLAAGIGTRLGRRTATSPKWLLEVDGGTVADRQLDALQGLFDLPRQLRVVTGHGAAKVGPFLRSRGLSEDCTIFNQHYATRNNWYSVLLALRQCTEEEPGRVFIINSDLYAPSAVYQDFVTRSRASDADACLAVDGVRALTDEAMKVEIVDGRIVDIGKVGVRAPSGEYIGMLMLDGPTAVVLRDLMTDWEAQDKDPNGWYETVIRANLLTRVECRPVEVGGQQWVEIDDPADLETALTVGR